ncbi:MAG: ketopantoate reductase family protein [Promethearchaeota archaeon]
MEIIILGMGAIGSLFGVKLFKAENSIYGLCRGEHYNKIKEEGLVFEDLEGKKEIIKCNTRFNVFQNKTELLKIISNLESIDWILITSKAYSLENLVQEYKEIIEKIKNVLVIQNGVGNEEIILKWLDKEHFSINLYRGTTTNGAYMVSPGHIRHTGKGVIKIGFPKINIPNKILLEKDNINKINEITKEKEREIRPLIEQLNKASIKTEFIADIDLVLWEKIFINVGINAIASIYNIRNGDLLKDEKYKEMMKEAIKEAWDVAKGIGIMIDKEPQYYIDLTFEVAQKTAKNKNSMLQDLMKGRLTEIDFINGYIVECGKNLKIKTPMNEFLTQEIKKLEKTKKLKA